MWHPHKLVIPPVILTKVPNLISPFLIIVPGERSNEKNKVWAIGVREHTIAWFGT